MTRTSAAVHVSDHSFGIFDQYEIPIETGDWSNGLIVTMASGAMIYTGIDRGYVNVTVELRTAAPEEVDPGSWDDIVEDSINSPHGHLCVELLEYAADDVGPELPLLSPQGPGSYRLRAHVRGRDRYHDQVQNEPAEDYLLIVWPADPAPPLIIRATDTCGYGLRLGSTQQWLAHKHSEHRKHAALQCAQAGAFVHRGSTLGVHYGEREVIADGQES